jgi:hypothetical protein
VREGADPERKPSEEELDQSSEEEQDSPRIPDPRPEDRDTKRYMTEGSGGPALKVQISGGEVASEYAPASLLGELAERVAQVVKSFNGGRAMIYRLEPGQSMVLWFGYPLPSGKHYRS